MVFLFARSSVSISSRSSDSAVSFFRASGAGGGGSLNTPFQTLNAFFFAESFQHTEQKSRRP